MRVRVVQKGTMFAAQRKVLGFWVNIGAKCESERSAQAQANTYLRIQRSKKAK